MRFTSGGTTVPMREPSTSMMVAVARGAGWLHAAGDLSPSFGGNAAVTRWQRELVYIEPNVVVVYDRAESAGGTQQLWQLVSPAQFTVNGATASVSASGHAMSAQRILPAGATGASRTLAGDFNGGFRYESSIAGGNVRHLHVVSVDGAVSSATASPSGSDDGVAISLADGRTATVRFHQASIGGSLSITGGSGPAVNETLEAGVDALPERP
jgi:hypothetical protein